MTSLTGWIAFVLLGLVALFPYLVRRNWLSNRLGTAKVAADRPYLFRMWPHIWFGHVLLLLSVIHTILPLQAMGGLRGVNVAGLWLGTIGLVFLLLQSLLGLFLQDRKLPDRNQVRSWHYWLMFGVAALVGVHVWLNG